MGLMLIQSGKKGARREMLAPPPRAATSLWPGRILPGWTSVWLLPHLPELPSALPGRIAVTTRLHAATIPAQKLLYRNPDHGVSKCVAQA